MSHAPYNSLPPTSGPHLGWTIAPGIYREPVPDELGVHALEHGHVLLQYANSTPQSEVELLEAVGRKHPRDVIVAPYPKLASGVAYTAWGRIQRLPRADAASADLFARRLHGRYNHGW